jgi:hypothetical protein
MSAPDDMKRRSDKSVCSFRSTRSSLGNGRARSASGSGSVPGIRSSAYGRQIQEVLMVCIQGGNWEMTNSRKYQREKHGRTAKGGQRPGPTMPYPFRGGPPTAQAAIFYPFGHPTPYAYEFQHFPSFLRRTNGKSC